MPAEKSSGTTGFFTQPEVPDARKPLQGRPGLLELMQDDPDEDLPSADQENDDAPSDKITPYTDTIDLTSADDTSDTQEPLALWERTVRTLDIDPDQPIDPIRRKQAAIILFGPNKEWMRWLIREPKDMPEIAVPPDFDEYPLHHPPFFIETTAALFNDRSAKDTDEPAQSPPASGDQAPADHPAPV